MVKFDRNMHELALIAMGVVAENIGSEIIGAIMLLIISEEIIGFMYQLFLGCVTNYFRCTKMCMCTKMSNQHLFCR